MQQPDARQPDPARTHFHTLTRDEQTAAIRRLAALGQSEQTIAAATGLSVEMVCTLIATQPSATLV
jgi:hypothetical protein